MRTFKDKVQQIGQKAAQIKQAIESVPPKIAEVRETVASAAGQFMQLRADVQSTINNLRTDSEDHLSAALRQIDGSTEVFRDAGYAVAAVEMEVGVVQRLIVHLKKFGDVPHSVLRRVMEAHQDRKTVHAILAALIKAEELSERVDLKNLSYQQLMVYVGLAPSVRLCWAAEEEEETAQPTKLSTPAAPAPAPPPTSAFTQSTYFERRAPTLATTPPTPLPSAPVAPTPVPAVSALSVPTPPDPAVVETGDSRHDALARFKKMPDLFKLRR